MPAEALSPGESRHVAGSGRVRLHYRAWEAAPERRAALLIVHGLGEHSGRYAPLAAELGTRGVAAFALDLRGHGLSGGRRGHAERFRDLVADLGALYRDVTPRLPAGLPVFLLGHSLGGLVVLRFLEDHRAPTPHGAVLSAPPLGLAVEAPRWKLALASLLSRLAPTLPLFNEIDPTLLSHDVEILEARRRDPLVHDRITPRLFTEMQRAIRRAIAESGRVRVPTLFLVPTGDRIVRSELAVELARGLGSTAELHTYPGLYHECLNEVERARVVADLVRWLERRIA